MKFGRMAVAAWALVLFTAAMAQDSYLLRYKFAPDAIHNYKMAFKMNGTMSGMPGMDGDQKIDMKANMLMKHKVAGVKDNVGTVKSTFSDAKFEFLFNEQDMSAMAGFDPKEFEKVVMTTKLDERGKTLEQKTEGMPERMQMGMATTGNFNFLSMLPVFPEAAIKIGDSWLSEVDMPMPGMAKAKAPKAKITATLIGLDTYKGTPVYKLQTVVELPADMTPETGEQGGGNTMHIKGITTTKGTVLLDRSDCSPVSLAMDMKSDTTVSGQSPMGEMNMKTKLSGTGSLELVK